jgi:hypothetical protein
MRLPPAEEPGKSLAGRRPAQDAPQDGSSCRTGAGRNRAMNRIRPIESLRGPIGPANLVIYSM